MIRKDFYTDILEKECIDSLFSYVYNLETKSIVSSSNSNNLIKNKLLILSEVPNYLSTTLISLPKSIKRKIVNTYEGSLINICDYNNIDEYLKKEISSQRRSNIKRCYKRLDTCIQPTYKMYYGDIDQSQYDKIFNDYKLMLKRRLAQKNSYWEELDYWEERYKKTYKLINEKKAAIFVIYNGHEPISIYINTIFKKTIYIEVIAYNIDYSKFKLGFLTLTKVIDWSIKNDFEIIDMSKGDFYYKERFRNGSYKFQNHIIYDSSSILISIKAQLLYLKLKSIYKILPLAKKWKINRIYKKYFVRKKIDYKNSNIVSIDIQKQEEPINEFDLKKIDINNSNYSFLRQYFFDYLFLNFEFIHDVTVYHDNKSTFFFKGRKSVQKNTLK
ncbi:GNAT family N-acetyltransferase [Seonamhaeicola sp. MEBiC1930]|uniref:GNAT family N-acetyltransferase n=1 Tax=Seonamhaeicola sp. MEBiC01930 TaxID=2976768 RepID=UPI00324F9496